MLFLAGHTSIVLWWLENVSKTSSISGAVVLQPWQCWLRQQCSGPHAHHRSSVVGPVFIGGGAAANLLQHMHGMLAALFISSIAGPVCFESHQGSWFTVGQHIRYGKTAFLDSSTAYAVDGLKQALGEI